MIWLAIGILLILVGYVIQWLVLGNNSKDVGSNFQFGGMLVTIIYCIAAFFITIQVIACKVDLVKVDRNMKVAEQRYDEVVGIITEKAKTYPLEKDLFENFHPKILLSLPQIKSDTFLMGQIELSVDFMNKIYELELKKNDIKRVIDIICGYKWFVPSFYWINYEEGEKVE